MIRIGQRGLEMPDALELPRMLSAVVPHMSRERLAGFRRDVVSEFVALPFRHSIRSGRGLARRESWLEPVFTAVIRALNDLSEPRARLRRVNPVRINRRSFQVIHFPTRKVRTVHFPVFALCVRSQ